MGISIIKKGASGGGDYTDLYIDNATHSHTGDLLETTLSTYSMPASTLAATDGLNYRCILYKTGALGACTIRLYLGATVLFSHALAAAAVNIGSLDGECWNTAANAQRSCSILQWYAFGFRVMSYTAAAENTAAALDIKVTAQLANAADAIETRMFRIAQVLAP